MALMSIFGVSGSRVGLVDLDATMQEVFTATATVTEHPVESGANVADHIKQEPDELQIDGIITQTPVDIVRALTDPPTRPESLWEELLGYKEDGEEITVHTAKRDYEDMVITKLTRTRAASVGEAVQVAITLRKIRKVTAQSVAAPQRKAGVPQPKQDLGKKPTAPVKSESILHQLSGWMSGG